MKIRRYFWAGLLVISPAFITIYILVFIATFIDRIWGKLINIYIKNHFGFTVPGIGLILCLVTLVIIGFIATNFIGKRIFKALEGSFMKFPIFREIYRPARQIINSLTAQDRHAFKKVVMVEYPSKGMWSIGFLTNDGFKEAQEKAQEELMHVFIASTPSPFTGFLVLVPKKSIKFLDIPIEDGIKLIVSGGILKP